MVHIITYEFLVFIHGGADQAEAKRFNESDPRNSKAFCISGI